MRETADMMKIGRELEPDDVIELLQPYNKTWKTEELFLLDEQ